jgi:hypothetical protein
MTAEQLDWLADLLLDGAQQSEIIARAKKEQQLAVHDDDSLDQIYDRAGDRVMRRRKRAAQLATRLVDAAIEYPSEFDKATIEELKQKVFELMIRPIKDPKEVLSLMGLLLKTRSQEQNQQDVEIRERRVALQEKVAEAKVAEAGPNRSPDESDIREAEELLKIL